MKKQKEVVIIGGGFSSLSASCYLAQAGYNVSLYEKNSTLGGRARQWKCDGFVFDIGPTFYWMPDVFEAFFNDFNKSVSQYYQLHRLNPSYQVYFDVNNSLSIANNLHEIKLAFENIEPGSGTKLQQFMDQAEKNYQLTIGDLVYQPGQHIFELVNRKTIFKLGLFFQSIRSQVAKYFKDQRLIKIMEFPILFLGAKPSKTPAFYNFMNYADFQLGTWYPQGGMYSVVEAMTKLAKELKVKLHTHAEVEKIVLSENKAVGVQINGQNVPCDILLSGADYAYTESLLPSWARQYSDKYWTRKTFAPSALLFYVGFRKKIQKVSHHTLFFDTDFQSHIASIYDEVKWPSNPLFYASFPSITDDSIAPNGHEAGIFLIPIAPGLSDSEEIRAKYLDIILDRITHLTGQEIKGDVLFSKSYGVNDFIEDYHAYKGNAYGLANTLLQTHILRPKLKSKKVDNLFFTGQLTVPGPGIPPSLISGKIVSKLINNSI